MIEHEIGGQGIPIGQAVYVLPRAPCRGVFSMDFSAITAASWINIPFKTLDANGVPFMSLPKFELGIILSIAPIAIVTFMEHIGDITTNGTVVGKNFLEDPADRSKPSQPVLGDRRPAQRIFHSDAFTGLGRHRRGRRGGFIRTACYRLRHRGLFGR